MTHLTSLAAPGAALIAYFETWGADVPKGEDFSGWGNYWPRHGYSYALAGLATYGDTPEAESWLDEYRRRRLASAGR